jgi:signal transduction histidine kinase
VLVLRVRDDGRGFDIGGTQARGRGSVGLELLAGLVSSHGGTLSVEASPGEGTELVLQVPVVVRAALSPNVTAGAKEDQERDVEGALR